MSPDSILRQVKKEALKANMRHQLGAVVLQGGRIISTGHNQRRHVRLPNEWANRKDTVCAERAALLKCMNTAKGGTLYVGRYTQGGKFRLAKPCEACLRMMNDLGIKRVFYTDNNGIFKEV
jgi:deoxycytidylate deaminase